MNGFIRSLDLYKVIILLSVVLLFPVGYWAYHLQGELEAGRRAIALAMRDGGEVQEIGKYQKAVEEQVNNSVRKKDATDTPNVYFDRCIRVSDRNGVIKRTDLNIKRIAERPAGPNARDALWEVLFKRDGKLMELSREFILAVLFNTEASSPVWKLRELVVKNVSASQHGSGSRKAPPPQLGDNWTMSKLTFASRRPVVGGQ